MDNPTPEPRALRVSPVARRLTVELPKRMRTLARDPRGYPIPFIVMRDRHGVPQFTINDTEKTLRCHRRRLCAICGKPHDRDGFWFIGGSRCFLHELGAFLDPPAHLECAEYSLRVCPFLAARSYARRIDAGKLAPGALPDGTELVTHDFMEPRLPELFGLGRTLGYERSVTPHYPAGLYTDDGWQYVEWWHGGERVDAPARGAPPADKEWIT